MGLTRVICHLDFEMTCENLRLLGLDFPNDIGKFSFIT